MTEPPIDQPIDPPIGPVVDAAPRPLPVRARIRGAYVELEPLHPRHVPELWRAAQAGTTAGDASFAYLGTGPFATEAALAAYVADLASQHDPMAWAVRPVATGVATGWMTLMDIQPRHASIEIGNIWFAPPMQRTRASSEAIFLLLRMAADELGYRRLVWKCNALNAPSRRAALRLGFSFEGVLRSHLVVKGRDRDTAYYSILPPEWLPARDALLAWLDPGNFSPDGTARQGLAELRAALEPRTA